MSTETASTVTPASQEASYLSGYTIGKLDRTWGSYSPPRPTAYAAPMTDPQRAAFIVGYDVGWSWQDMIETLRLVELADIDTPATDEEAQFELDCEYYDEMGKW